MLQFADVPDANVLWTLDFIATIFSLFGSITMIFSCLKTPSPKSISLKFITTIGVANLLYSVSNFMSNFEENEQSGESEIDLCSYEAILRQFSYSLLVFLSSCLAVAASYSIHSINQLNNKTLFFYFSVVIGLVISFLYFFVVPGFFENTIVIAQGPFYCWFTYSSHASRFDRLLLTGTFQGLPIIIGLITTLIAYVLAKRQIRSLSRGAIENSYLRVLKVFWYPAILFILFVPTAIDGILRIYENESPVWINALYLVLPHSIGFIHAVLYGIQTKFGKKNYQDFGRTAESNSIYLSFAVSSSS